MKETTFEKLYESEVIVSKRKNLLFMIPSLIWGLAAIIMMLSKNGTDVISDLNISGNAQVKVEMLIWIIFFGFPFVFGGKTLIKGLKFPYTLSGNIEIVIFLYVLSIAFVVVGAWIAGIAIIIFGGILRSVILFVMMIIYNAEISKINNLCGDLTSYVENEKFIKKLNNIAESIDCFAEINWITQKKYEQFAKQYSMLIGMYNLSDSKELAEALKSLSAEEKSNEISEHIFVSQNDDNE